MVTVGTVIKRLEEVKFEYQVVDVGNGSSIVIMVKGGRVLGPFLSEKDVSLSWLNHAWCTKENFARFVKDCEWNFGGSRIWLAPEIEYNVRNLNDFWETYIIPPEIDPGKYQIIQRDGKGATLYNEFKINAFRSKRTPTLAITKRTVRAENPLRYLTKYSEKLVGIRFGGYEEEITLEDRDPSSCVLSGIWNILQIPRGGRVFLPCTPGIEVTDYFEPTSEKHLHITDNMLTFNIDGRERHKIGLSPTGIFNQVGYVRKVKPGGATLLVRNFVNNPSGFYIDRPANQLTKQGDLLQIYNDSGAFGGFGEIECHAPAIGLQTGLSKTVLCIQTWGFSGKAEEIKLITQILLGAKI